ncbi:MAG: hypothetical protein M3P38_10760 [Chloroflexota bacterium]|nr:hypothetical protein [Chloroflexota bacterium]
MRAQVVAVVGAFVVLATTSCADQGNLYIRCPDAGGAVPVNDGQVTIDGVVIRVAADLTVPAAAADEGMTVAIELQLPDSPSHTSPSVQCARMRIAKDNTQWDVVPSRIEERYDGSTARIRATARDGPHWRLEDPVEVTIWLKTTSGRHVLALGRPPIRTAP